MMMRSGTRFAWGGVGVMLRFIRSGTGYAWGHVKVHLAILQTMAMAFHTSKCRCLDRKDDRQLKLWKRRHGAVGK